MHRIKRSSPKTKSFGFSRVHSRPGHDLPGEESKTKTIKRNKSGNYFQLNVTGGPLKEDFEA